MVADARPPLVARLAFLEARVVDREGNQLFLWVFVGIFVFWVHK